MARSRKEMGGNGHGISPQTAKQNHNPGAVLIATLGSEAQVVTAALDLLRRKGEQIGRVEVVHTTAPGTPVGEALARLQGEFAGNPDLAGVTLQLRALRTTRGQLLEDVETPEAARVAFRALYAAVRAAKLDGLRVHLCIAGGRKTMAVFGMAAAQLLFEPDDRLWHLHSWGAFLESKRMHPEAGDEVHLVSIPLILWGQVSPLLAGLDQVADPYEAVEKVQRSQLHQRYSAARAFVRSALTEAEERVVEALVRSGGSDARIAANLHLSPRTVERHLRSAYQKAAECWELETVSRTHLIALLNIYYLSREH